MSLYAAFDAVNMKGTVSVPTAFTSTVGVGTTAPGSLLSVAGGASIGSTYQANVAPANGLIVAGNVGIGTTAPGSLLSVAGGASIGSTYQANVAPANGLIVAGNVGIGTTNPGVALEVTGNIRQSSLPVLRAYAPTDQAIGTGENFIPLTGISFNTQWTATSSNRFTLNGPTGYYLVTGNITYVVATTMNYVGAAVFRNGAVATISYTGAVAGTYACVTTTSILRLSTNDYLELKSVSSASYTAQSSSDGRTALHAVYLSGQ